MALGTLSSRILGFIRTIMLASLLGLSGSLTDIFSTANTVPNNINGLLVVGLLNAVLVPQIVRASKNADGGQAYLDRLLTIAGVGIIAITAAALALAPQIPSIFAQADTWDSDTRALCIAFSFWCLPQVLFYGLYAILGQVLNARGQFGAYMWAPVVNNLVAIAGLGVMLSWIGSYDNGQHPPQSWTTIQIAVLAGSATLGVAAQALILVPPLLRIGFRFRPSFNWRGVGLRSAGRVVGWTFAAALLGQVGFVAITRVLTAAGDQNAAGLTAYNTSYLLFILPHSVVTVSLVTALFTRMSESAKVGDLAQIRSDYSTGLRLTGVAALLAMAGMMAVGPDLTGTLFFTKPMDETRAVANITIALLLGLLPFSAQYLGQRVYYAFADAKTPFLIQIPVVLTIIGSSILSDHLLPPKYVALGIAAGLSLAYVVGALLAYFGVNKRVGQLGGRQIMSTLGRAGLATIPAVILGRLCSMGIHAVIGLGPVSQGVSLLCGGFVVVLSYVVFCHLLRVTELAEVTGPILRRIRPHTKGPAA